ncbi:hypothetical protein [Halococcus salifodinae]|uniref:Glycosyltransferase RgtA/B/C/D-like domain-containing protein n=1 Tax=Halococcus salifodinae DSM 8989 TaxID=1227456 RepID=M0N1H6_9EURY|nr:hypothetical protein [Halococcus salifodinae]EMA51721.1 hypothetical protein C450_12133 [Halococcus salifodinae DSM 8989]
MRTAKLCATVCTFSFAAMVLGAHETRQLFPWVHGFAFISAMALVVGAFFGRLSAVSSTVLATGIGVALRIFIFEWPASMIGMDPDKYAVGVIRIIQTGSLVELKQAFSAHGILSAFHLLNSQVALVSGFDGRNVLVAIPILIGIVFPLTAVALTSHHTRSPIAIGLSGTIAAIATIGVLFGYWPIVQTIAVLLWCPVIIGLSRFFSADDGRDFVMISVLVLATAFAHKLSMFILTGAIGAALTIRYVRIDALLGHQPIMDDGEIQTRRPWIVWLLLVLGLGIQWMILTIFVRTVIIAKAIPLLTGGFEIAPSGGEALAAVPANPGIVGILERRGDFLVLLPITAIASFVLWIQERTWSMCLLLGATLISALIVGISVVGVGIASPQRAILFGIPIFAAVLGIAAKRIVDLQSTPQLLAICLVVLIVVGAQAGSAMLAPNYPDEPRKYLTSEEVTAKTFTLDHSPEPVAMDFYYADEQVDLDDPSATQKTGRGHKTPGAIELNTELLNATLINKSYSNILLRDAGNMILGGGRYRLTWDPIRVFSNHDRYNRVFDNGPVVGFDNNTESST